MGGLMKKQIKFETIEDFLSRGGEIQIVKSKKIKPR